MFASVKYVFFKVLFYKKKGLHFKTLNQMAEDFYKSAD